MKTEIVNITPELAAQWLQINYFNRTLRRPVVDRFKAVIRRGEYVLTHQGIAFSEAGTLLDGQHRLTAISESPGVCIPMLVSWGLPEQAYEATDLGLKRTDADSLRTDDRRVVECARRIAVICLSNRSSITPTMLNPLIDAIKPAHTLLINFCPTAVKTWSSAPVRVAAVFSMMTGGDTDYIRGIYRALVLSDFDAMPKVVQALYKAHLNGHIRAADSADMIARCMVAFSPSKAANTKIQISDTGESMAKIRSAFGHLVPREEEAEKKMAAPTGAAKSVLPFDYSQLMARS